MTVNPSHTSGPTNLAAFQRFLDEARALQAKMTAQDTRASTERLAEFERFVLRSNELLLRDAKPYLDWLAPAWRAIEPSLRTPDVLAVARITHDEDRYTELLRWMLWPDDLELATACQRAWVGYTLGRDVRCAVCPVTQMRTKDGIPDLVLPYADGPVVLEAKTVTTEHTTPTSRQPQTVSYVAAVSRALGGTATEDIGVVYLTLDRSRPANALARPMSYLEVALVLADVVESRRTSEPMLSAYRVVLGHLARRAVPDGLRIDAVDALVGRWREDPKVAIGADALVHLARCKDLLPAPETSR